MIQRLNLQLPQLSLKSAITWLEDSIITLSGPAIAISGVIAGIDLLTGGSMFKDIAWLSLTWAICLLLTLDFQVLMLGARARRVYSASDKKEWRKVGEIVIIILIAAAISSVSVQMQSIIARSQTTTVYTDKAGQHMRNLTIDEATRDMGINPVALIWERSALVLILIFMSGWFRDEERQSQDQAVVPTIPAPEPLDYAKIVESIAPLIAPQLQGLKDTIVAEIRPLIPAPAPAPEPLNYRAIAAALVPMMPKPEPAPRIDYSQIAASVAPLVKPEPAPAPQIDHQAIARAVAPLLTPRVEAMRTTIIEEIRATIAPLMEPGATVPALPETSASRESPRQAEESQESREARLESTFQHLRSQNNGARVSGRALAEAVHMNRKTVNEWLRRSHPENEAGAGGSDLDASAGSEVDLGRGADTEQIPAITLDLEPAMAH